MRFSVIYFHYYHPSVYQCRYIKLLTNISYRLHSYTWFHSFQSASTMCAQVDELPWSHYCDDKQGTFFLSLVNNLPYVLITYGNNNCKIISIATNIDIFIDFQNSWICCTNSLWNPASLCNPGALCNPPCHLM